MSRALSFRVAAWSAWAPGLDTAAAWQAWRHEARQPEGDDVPPVAAMPAMLRRRAERLGRMALETLYADAITYRGQPIVYASRHGETGRIVPLLQQLAAEGSVSPQAFSMAVHNAIPGLFTIAQRSNAPVTAIAAGPETAFAGLTEALAQLQEGAPSVLLCLADHPLPAVYAAFADAAEAPVACVLELAPGNDFVLDNKGSDKRNARALDVLYFLLGPAPKLGLTVRGGWQCRRVTDTPPDSSDS
ncbi:Beta-ketoacyl synthase, N-terminal domain [Andreprevotia lacus DSM 23236]|uniref:Beta-ketoacyl synthase, N-terminal domain n=1 Tax=Andreprevotia lacus DSM 23236 TaxID=1121001 RepID=A0A1W1X439_9NEIS|nr:beta-ketoacyl synthase chain length factor [Andreprevotia lacus]SMC18637.1 Beta-ketoacyl synthase, N-terminal domain [Andreprevotia lacus DSM 23236]